MKKTVFKRSLAALLTLVSVAALSTGCDSKPDDTSTTTTEPVVVTATTASQAAETTTSGGGTTQLPSSTQVVAKPTTTTSRTVQTATTTKPTVDPYAHLFPVKETKPIRQAAAAVNNKLTSEKTKIQSDCVLLADYDPEWAFTHQPGFTYFKGKFYASWASGKKDEDAPGQRAVIVTSTDAKKWSKPQVIAEPGDGILAKNAIVGGQFFNAGDTLYYYYFEHELGPDLVDFDGNYIHPPAGEEPVYMNTYRYFVSTTDGVNWTEPHPGGTTMNESPRKSLTNRWFAGAGNVLVFDDNPDGKSWATSGLSGHQVTDALSRGARILTECSWYQTKDYVVHMMIRSNSGYIWMSNSYDNGETWTDPYPTKITTASSMMNFGTLPDGRHYFVGSTYYDRRYPLELYVSEDGVNFNKGYILRDEIYKMQQDGWAKGGEFAYPEVFIKDGYMYVCYSKQKEVMELTIVKLSDIK